MINKEVLKLSVATLFVLLFTLFIASRFIDPAPPKRIVFATGAKDGAYYSLALKYKDYLAKHGVELEIRETRGSVEILKLVNDSERDTDAGFVQGGIFDIEENIYSLASVFYEPLWIFYRGSKIENVADLKGRRITVGITGSGTNVVAQEILRLNNISSDNSELIHADANSSLKLLEEGKTDACFMVVAPHSKIIRKAFSAKDVKLFSFERGEAYKSRLRFLSDTVLYEGMVDLSINIPRQDIKLLSPVANLIVNKDLHPVLVLLLLKAAVDIHYKGGFLEPYGKFPDSAYLSFEQSPEAQNYLKNGPSFLHKVFPFWAAVMADRLKILLLPLLTLCYPLVKLLPPVYRWKISYNIKKAYKDLIMIECEKKSDKAREQLEKLRERIDSINVPPSHAHDLYQLKLHFDLVNKSVVRKAEVV